MMNKTKLNNFKGGAQGRAKYKCTSTGGQYNPFNKLNLIFLVLLFLVSMTQYSFAEIQGDYLYPAEISAYRFLPSAIMSGDTVSVAVDVFNKGSLVSMNDIQLSLDINSGDYLEPVEGSKTIINSIAAGSTKTAILKFKVKDNTISGYYQLFLNMSFSCH
jgi:hypothetical protein